jgi:hypothetical protein
VSRLWKMFLLTLVIGAAAFLTGPKIWPMAPDVPTPPENLLPAYIVPNGFAALSQPGRPLDKKQALALGTEHCLSHAAIISHLIIHSIDKQLQRQISMSVKP